MKCILPMSVLLAMICDYVFAQTNLELIDYYEAVKTISASDYFLSDTPVIAIIDNGVNLQHDDLSDNIWYNKTEIPGNGFFFICIESSTLISKLLINQ